MIKVTNSNEFNDSLSTTTTEPVQFPANTNILLGYTDQPEVVEQLERVGCEAGRSVHLRLSA